MKSHPFNRFPTLLGVLFSLLCNSVHARTWTSTSGKTMEGELVRVQRGTAYLRVGERVGPIPIKGLSRPDQVFIEKWVTDQKMAQLTAKLDGLTSEQEAETSKAAESAPTGSIDTGLTDAEHPKSLAHIKSTLKAIQSQPGDSTDKGLQGAINNLNAYRYLCGLDYEVTLDETYSMKCTAAASICKALGRLSHGPENPGWEEDRYQLAREGAGRSNLMSGGSVSGSVHAYMNDSDSGNISELGHRRWCLNPRMGQTGFGSDDRYSAMWSMDGSNSKGSDLPFIAFPTPGYMPTDYFRKGYAWCVSLQKPAYKYPDALTPENVKVYKIRWNETRPRPGEQPLKLSFFNYSRAGYGIPCCIIFKPEGVEVEHRDRYWVEIDGIEKTNGINTKIEYLVDFTRI
jgi:hypothetical protein